MSTYNPRDLSIHIKATSKSQHVLNGGPKGASFPGWFATVLENEGYTTIAGPVQLSIDEVTHITERIDSVINLSDPAHPLRITNAAKRCDSAMKEDLRRQLKAAELQAARIPALKKLLGE